MFSLRAFSRSLPRLGSRNAANYTTRSAFRPSIQPSLRSAAPLRQPLTARLAAFSTSSSRADTASQELAAKLANEISLESDNAERKTDSDSNVEAFLNSNSWEVIDNAGEQDVILKRTYDDETILVSFSIADFNTPQMYGEEEDGAYADEVEDPEDMSAQSGGGNTKGAVNQGRTGGGNFKVAPEDSIAPADREELANEEVSVQCSTFQKGANGLIRCRTNTTTNPPSPPTSTSSSPGPRARAACASTSSPKPVV